MSNSLNVDRKQNSNKLANNSSGNSNNIKKILNGVTRFGKNIAGKLMKNKYMMILAMLAIKIIIITLIVIAVLSLISGILEIILFNATAG